MNAIIVIVFVACFLLAYSLLRIYIMRRDPVRARLQQLANEAGVNTEDNYDLRTSLLRKGVNLLSTNVQTVSNTAEFLARAGYLRHSAVFDYYLIIVVLMLTGLLTAGVIGILLHLSSTKIIFMAAASSVIGGLMPRFYLTYRINKRRDAIRQAVPNMLDLLVVCVEAGLSFTASIQKLSDEMRNGCPEIAHELKIVTQEILIGKPKSEAFRMLANRTKVAELRALAVTLIQADRLGTSIGSSLRVLADSMRFKRRQRAEEAANKVSVKLVFPLVLLIFPELLIVLVGPAMINIFKALQDVAK